MRRWHAALAAAASGALPAVVAIAAPPSPSGASSSQPASSSAPTPPSAPASSSAPTSSSAPAAPVVSSSAPAASSASLGRVYATCVEHVPEGATRPTWTLKAPPVATAGWALRLEIELTHGAGETVLHPGLSSQRGAEADGLAKAGFRLPNPDGGAGTEVRSTAPGKTVVIVHVVPLPKEPGTVELELPPLPLSIARASGEVVTVCTQPLAVRVVDPTASIPDARARPNPPARRQLEDWVALRDGLIAGGVTLLGALVGWLALRAWRRRPRRLPPPPPPRPAWERALEDLSALRARELVERGELIAHVDALSEIVRRYLGDRFGFDGLEATTREIQRALRAVTPPLPVMAEIERVLSDADLVKFAKAPPDPEGCLQLLALAEAIVHATIPASLAPGEAGAGQVPR